MLNENGASQQPLEVKDFSGGITDNFIGAPSSKYKTADNFYIIKVGELSRLITRPGMKVYDTVNSRVPTNTKINKLFNIDDQLIHISNKRVYVNNSGFSHITGPSGNEAFDQGNSNSNYSVTKWSKQYFATNDSYSLPVKIFYDSGWKVQALGLPEMTGNPTFSSTSTNTYYYAFHYYYQYNNNGITYEEEGPVYFYNTPFTGSIPNTVTFPASFTLTNGASLNYDTANIKIKIYRTQHLGTSWYYIGEVAHNATNFLDSIGDGSLVNNSPMPYLPDSPLNEAPPRCKYIHQVNGNLICANIKVNGVVYPNKFRMNAKPFIWSMPSEFEEELEETIKGVNSYGTQPIIYCEKLVYRIEGENYIDGSGGISKKVIHNTAGLINANSIVKTDIGLFWCGNDGWYWTDGYKVLMISKHLNNTYKSLTQSDSQKNFISGEYDPVRNIVKWLMLSDDTNQDSDCAYILHLNYGISEEMPFTTWSGAENFRATCSLYFKNKLLQSDINGYLLYYDDDSFDDVKVDILTPASSWGTKAIIYDHISSALDFQTTSFRKWVPSISVRAENASSISLLISANNDNSLEYKTLKEVNYKGKEAWGDPLQEWGDLSIRWNYFPIIAFERRFPSGGLRCTYKQIRFTNNYVEIDSSASGGGTATFDGVTNQVTLGTTWPSGITEYFISSSFDNYENQYRIKYQSGSILTVDDTVNTLPTGTFAWKIMGNRKSEILKIISYTLNYAIIGQSFEPYKESS